MRALYLLLRKGKTNAISRAELSAKTGLSDRNIRDNISKLRKQGIPVISNSDTKGYYIAETQEEFEHFIRENDKRAKDILYVSKQVKDGFNRYKYGYPLFDGKEVIN